MACMITLLARFTATLHPTVETSPKINFRTIPCLALLGNYVCCTHASVETADEVHEELLCAFGILVGLLPALPVAFLAQFLGRNLWVEHLALLACTIVVGTMMLFLLPSLFVRGHASLVTLWVALTGRDTLTHHATHAAVHEPDILPIAFLASSSDVICLTHACIH